jgi:ribonuclease P/MRP protein subunit POP5
LLHPRLAYAVIEPANQNRWLLVEFIPATTTTASSAQAISGKDVFNALKQSVLVNFGDNGWGEVGGSLAGTSLPSASRKNSTRQVTLSLHAVKYFSPTTHLCIIRVARGEAARTTWAALVLLDRIGNNEEGKVVPHVIHVSGVRPITI